MPIWKIHWVQLNAAAVVVGSLGPNGKQMPSQWRNMLVPVGRTRRKTRRAKHIKLVRKPRGAIH